MQEQLYLQTIQDTLSEIALAGEEQDADRATQDKGLAARMLMEAFHPQDVACLALGQRELVSDALDKLITSSQPRAEAMLVASAIRNLAVKPDCSGCTNNECDARPDETK